MELQIIEEQKGDFQLSTDPTKLDLKVVHHFLSTDSYWSKGIPYETVQQASEHSLCFGVYHHHDQVGYARVISDYTSIAYLADVFILPDYRGQGLAKWLTQSIRAHPNLQGLRRWILLTRDAHSLYEQSGWSHIAQPELWMEIHQKDIYRT
jgi:GNAT superfamily N-acetyltransferase